MPIFQRFDVYFYGEIRNRGWNYLLHELEEEYYIEFLVRKFFDGFTARDIDVRNGRIYVKWDGTTKVVDLAMISGVTGIPLGDEDNK